MISSITAIPDLIRGTRAFPEGFFDQVREPLLQGCGLRLGHPPGAAATHGMHPDFDLETFRRLVADVGMDWGTSYHRLPEAAQRYLADHLPREGMVLSFEMPPWLADACTSAGLSFLDMRVSPLRFGRDLYIAFRASDPAMRRRLAGLAVSAGELRLEASHLAANVRMHRRRLAEAGRHDFPLARSVVFVGQAPYDASLLDAGRVLRCADFGEQIREAVGNRRLLHKPHPFAEAFAAEERGVLAHLIGRDVASCPLNAYQILAADEDVTLLGISSGLLQEAHWFDKTGHALYRPFVPLALPGADDTEGYLQVHYHAILSPEFWHRLLTPERDAPVLPRLPPLPHHHGRETLDQWWDYGKVLTWERALPYESFTRSGGGLLCQRLDALEAMVCGNAEPPATHRPGDAAPDDARWTRCMESIQEQLRTEPQQFGRGQLYQAHEDWGVAGQRPTLQRIREYRLEQFLPPRARVLDIGCNIGMFGLALSPLIAGYHGLDSNPALIGMASQMAAARGIGNCDFECADFNEFATRCRPGSFDVALAFAAHVWIGMPPADYARMLHRLLREGGTLVLESNNLASNDRDFFQNARHFTEAGFSVSFRGLLKDDGVIERAFYVFAKEAA